MIIEFSSENFLSFNKLTNFSMVSQNPQDKAKTIVVDDKLSLNKTSVVFGANASGKTNFLKTIRFIKNMILFSSNLNIKASKMGFSPFLLNNGNKKTSFFEVIFLIDDVQYKYNFTIENGTDKILEENLWAYLSQKPSRYLHRKNTEFVFNGDFKEGNTRKEFVTDTSLAITKFAENNGEISRKIFNFFRDKVHIFYVGDKEFSNPLDTYDMFDKYGDKFKDFLINVMKSADVCVSDIYYKKSKKKISELPPEHQLVFSDIPGMQQNEEINFVDDTFGHKKYDDKGNEIDIKKFTKDLESKGTIRLYELSGSLYNVIKNDMALFIDELDTSLHPLLLREIIGLFYSIKGSKSQLIFNAHDISLIRKETKLFNKDQIRFADKNRYGESSLYSLEEFKNIRSNDLEKMYLEGRFSATPKTKKITF